MAGIGNAHSSKISLIAGSSTLTTTSQYMTAYMSGSMTACIATDSTDLIVGMIESYQSAGSDAVSIITNGLAKGYMVTGTTCAIGAMLVADGWGRLDTFDAAVTQTAHIVGMALDVPVTTGAVTILVQPRLSVTI